MIDTLQETTQENPFKAIFQHKKAFLAYLTAGHKGLDYTEKAAKTLMSQGVDILEIGVPFSDPIADGPVIQAAMTDALSRQTNLQDVLLLIQRLKQQVKTPIVLFSYLNPLLRQGLATTLQQCKACGVDGLLIVDLPLEESSEYFTLCQQYGLNTVSLISPSTPTERLAAIIDRCTGFLYYVCRHGTTGVKGSLPEDYAANMQRIKALTRMPVVSGFGIGNRQLADLALHHADGFVVGSAFVQLINEGREVEALGELARQIDPR